MVRQKRIHAGNSWLLALFIGMFLLCDLSFAATSMQLERTRITENESVRLVIETNSSENGIQPDVTPLEKDFRLLGSSSGQNISIVNGQQTIKSEYGQDAVAAKLTTLMRRSP